MGRLRGQISALIILGIVQPIMAADDEFSTGPVIQEYGAVAKRVKQSWPLPKEQHFKVAFDLAKQSESGEINRGIESLARFLNMQAASGVDPVNIQLALVVHGKAIFDVLSDQAHINKLGRNNAQSGLLQALLDKGVRIMVCGQTAAHYGIDNHLLHPGVEMSLSAMTAHALLSQQGYSLNPF